MSKGFLLDDMAITSIVSEEFQLCSGARVMGCQAAMHQVCEHPSLGLLASRLDSPTFLLTPRLRIQLNLKNENTKQIASISVTGNNR